MSAIQNIKNFIRHGKQAKFANAEPTTNVSAVHAQPQPASALSEPNFGEAQKLVVPQNEYSTAGFDNRNVAARAADAAAHAAGQHQKKGPDGQAYDPEMLERIITEEREARGKFPNYPGLERWILLEKMGDGAFSNVYRAKDTQGQYEQVAIKVVRKYEMNSNQVRTLSFWFVFFLLAFCIASLLYFRLLVSLLRSCTFLGLVACVMSATTLCTSISRQRHQKQRQQARKLECTNPRVQLTQTFGQ
jgi:hypothetical protein